jgi:hypothetical protein
MEGSGMFPVWFNNPLNHVKRNVEVFLNILMLFFKREV